MRVLHFADLHLGVENYGRTDPASGLHSRLLDFLRAFDFIVDYAVSNEIDLVLFCGDAFRAREPSPTLACLFAERIKRLADAGLPVLLLLGNHDLPPLPGRKSSLEIYPILEVPEVHVAATPGLRRIETRSGPLQVACLPAANYEAGSAAEALRRIEEMAQAAEPDSPAILAAHVSIKGARVGSEGMLGLGRELVLGREELLHPRFSYVALGHVHSFQDLNPKGAPPLVYCGSPERVDFSEANEPKGFVVVDIERAAGDAGAHATLNSQFSASYRFVETPARKFVRVDVDLEEGGGTLEVLETLAAQKTDDAVVKITVRSQDEAPLDDGEIRRALEGATFVAPLTQEIEKPRERLRAPELAKGWDRPLIALDEYLKTSGLSEERKTKLRKAAKELLSAPEPE